MFPDTTFCIDLLREQSRGTKGPASSKLESLGGQPLLISLFVLCDLRAGAEMAGNPRRELSRVVRLIDGFDVISPTPPFAILYGEIVAALLRNGTPVPRMDVLLGVMAKSFGMPVLTRDANHFGKIPGLVVESY
ncbi:MAG: type II toxin-antitoxin system VapC family toxin [Spirochaetia bacterium]|jgi:predicted nucleic acid-binding protein